MYRTLDIQQYEPQSFFTKAEISDDCWEWRGSKYANGYGKIGKAGYMAHRIAYELTKGSVPEDMALDHLCRNRGCINPDHLEVVSLVENVMRGESQHAKNARKTHCTNGHEFNEANTYKRKDHKARECRTCRREAVRICLDKKRGY